MSDRIAALGMFENPEDFRTEFGFEKLLFGLLVTKAEVCKDVAATLFDLNVIAHGLLPRIRPIL